MSRALVLAGLLLLACGSPVDGFGDAGAGGGSGGGTGGDAGDTTDAGAPDAGTSTDAGLAGLLYPVGQRHSPLTESVAAHLREIAALGPSLHDDIFSKVGDSNTVNTNYVSCFAGANVNLDVHTALEPALSHFKAGAAGTTTPFDRTGLAATVGWSAWAPITGSPSPLDQEVAAVSPRFATVMFGTNDIQAADLFAYGRNLFGVVDRLLAKGVIPLVTSIPPRDDSATADAWVPRYDLVARGVAQARKIPFVDLTPELRLLPNHGIGPDGLHLEVYTVSGAPRGCVLTPTGLEHGHNLRNLMTLEGLARAWDAVRSAPAPDATAPVLPGDGSAASPFEIPSLPFVDLHDTRVEGASTIASYPGCAAAQNESGHELFYRFTLAQPATVRIFVISLGGSDLDVHLLSAPTGVACLERNDTQILRSLSAGTYWLSLDTFVTSAGVAKSGEFLVGVMTEP